MSIFQLRSRTLDPVNPPYFGPFVVLTMGVTLVLNRGRLGKTMRLGKWTRQRDAVGGVFFVIFTPVLKRTPPSYKFVPG